MIESLVDSYTIKLIRVIDFNSHKLALKRDNCSPFIKNYDG